MSDQNPTAEPQSQNMPESHTGSQSSPRKVLVAGASSYLGSYVAKELKDRGVFVRALVHSESKLRAKGVEADEVFEAEITRPETLTGACDGMDAVFSAVGITRQADGLTWRDVDYQGNLNLLQEASAGGVHRMVYVSVFAGPRLRHLDMVAAHEDFADRLLATGSEGTAGLDGTVIRPTGYFSDLDEFLEMAKTGRVFLFGRGDKKVNPIHGSDLARVCADAIEARRTDPEIDVGGPEILTWREVAEAALDAYDHPRRITGIPVMPVAAVASLLRLIDRRRADLLRFFLSSAKHDMVAPRYGTRDLRTYFRERVASS